MSISNLYSCPDDKIASYWDRRSKDYDGVMLLRCDNSGDSDAQGNSFLFHKTCCHKIRAVYQPDRPRSWRTPMQNAIDDSVEGKIKDIKLVSSKYEEIDCEKV